MLILRQASLKSIASTSLPRVAVSGRIFLRDSTNMASTDSAESNKGGITKWADKDGSFKRQTSSFRDLIGDDKFPPEKGELGQ